MLRETQVFKVSLSDLFSTLSGKFAGRVDKDHFFDRFGVQNSSNETNLVAVECHQYRVIYRTDANIRAVKFVDAAVGSAVPMYAFNALIVLGFDCFGRGKLIAIDRFFRVRRDALTPCYLRLIEESEPLSQLISFLYCPTS